VVDDSEELRVTELAKVSGGPFQKNAVRTARTAWESTAYNSFIAGNSGKALPGLRVPDIG